MGRYEEIDLRRLKRIEIARRRYKVERGMLADPPTGVGSFADFWDGLPGTLAALDLHTLARAIVTARNRGRPVIWMFGAHVIKVGLGPLLTGLLREDFATLLAVNGAFTIHDAELALWGVTSEDVARELHEGRFGMVKETSQLLNEAAVEAAKRGEGLGESIGRMLLERRDAWITDSVMGVAYDMGIPATVHVAVGTDITHQHPEFSGEATGGGSARDFRIFAKHLQDLEGAVVVNVGSAVILPEVFLKAFSVVTNLGANSAGLVTATLDFNRHYRPLVNVVQRPHRGPQGIYLIGHHEILLPLLFQGLLLERDRFVVSKASRCGECAPNSR
ncbi:MAG: hypothetical protein KAY24_11465 [Candidatus Eisenbacteria sp.]|nr:hypothetical protein [Candidatus Eisenbacteria bacterium]